MRGLAAGEPIQSQAQTEEFDAGYDRTFGTPDGSEKGGRWIWDMRQGRLVKADEYQAEPRAVDAPIISDRIHEGTAFDDGERVRDLGSRRKRREFLREQGLAEASDFGPKWSERRQSEINRGLDRKTHDAFDQAARKLYQQGKLR